MLSLSVNGIDEIAAVEAPMAEFTEIQSLKTFLSKVWLF